MGKVTAKEIVGELHRIKEKIGKTPSVPEFKKHGKFGFKQVAKIFGSYLLALRAAGLTPGPTTNTSYGVEIQDLKILKQKIKNLEMELTEEKKRTQAAALAVGARVNEIPKWLTKKLDATITGIPMLFISDVHFDEVVRPEEIENYNRYNREIAVRRLQTCFERAGYLCLDHFKKPQFDGIVVALGGDMVSGNIHEELSETNQHRILRTCLDLTATLAAGIRHLADRFGKVYVPCVTGNHGRLSRKPRYKFRAQDNFDWMVYQMLAKEFASDARVTVHCPEGSDLAFHIYGKRFLLTHGDQFRGGGGIAGVFSPLMLGHHRKNKRNQAFDRPFDVMMMGHWHQYIHTESLIVNGSVKGYDEYAYQNNLPPEPPQQSLSIVRPDGEITFRMPVLCDQKKAVKKPKKLVAW